MCFLFYSTFLNPKSFGQINNLDFNYAIDNVRVEKKQYMSYACTVMVASGDSLLPAAGQGCKAGVGTCKKEMGCTAIAPVQGQVDAQNSGNITLDKCHEWALMHTNKVIDEGFYDAQDFQSIYDFTLQTLVNFYNL